jgi:hypothetical protein
MTSDHVGVLKSRDYTRVGLDKPASVAIDDGVRSHTFVVPNLAPVRHNKVVLVSSLRTTFIRLNRHSMESVIYTKVSVLSHKKRVEHRA